MRSSGALILFALAGAGCFDFGKFTQATDGGPDQAVPDLAQADLAARDLSGSDLVGLPDLTMGPQDLIGCPLPIDGNILSTESSMLDTGEGAWFYFNANHPMAPGCLGSGILLCHPSRDGGTSASASIVWFQPIPGQVYRAIAWADPASPNDVQLTLKTNDQSGKELSRNATAPNPDAGWIRLETTLSIPGPAGDGGPASVTMSVAVIAASPDDCVVFDDAYLGIE
jgi:hypothetical protein